MGENQSADPDKIALGIEREIRLFTEDRIRGMRVEVRPDVVAISGQCDTLHSKQLASLAAMAFVGQRSLENLIDLIPGDDDQAAVEYDPLKVRAHVKAAKAQIRATSARGMKKAVSTKTKKGSNKGQGKRKNLPRDRTPSKGKKRSKASPVKAAAKKVTKRGATVGRPDGHYLPGKAKRPKKSD